jgi:hypothetical protein
VSRKYECEKGRKVAITAAVDGDVDEILTFCDGKISIFKEFIWRTGMSK